MKNILGSTKLQPIFLIVISLFLAFIPVIGNLWQEIRQRAAPSPIDYTRYVHMVQGPGMPINSDRQVFMRYPLGRVGLWSRGTGEIADSVTRGVRLYPSVDQIVNKDNTDWRNTITANPSQTDITYRSDVAAKGSTVALTVTPNVSIYRYHFNNVSSYAAVVIKLQNPYYSSTWINNTITIVDNQTIQATLGNSDRTIYYYIKFNVSAIGRGTFIGSAITGGSSSNTGANSGGYLKFNHSTPDVTVAVALSHTSMAKAQQFFTDEFSDFNFAAASQRLKDAWNAKLGKIDVQNADQITKQMLYTGLYTVYANVINATDGSPYAPYAAAYGSPILTIGSSPDWAYVWGGYLRCQFDVARNVYALLSLIDPGLMTDILHTYQAQYDLNKVMLGNWDPYCTRCWNDQQWGFFGGMFLRAYLQGVTGVDYTKDKNSIVDTFGNTNNYMYKSQYLTKGYIPANGGSSEYMSRGLEFSTDVQGLALLANALGDNATYNQYIGRGQNYKNNWDAVNKVFRGKNSDGSWAAMNTGFYEGSEKRYAFDVVHDPLGLADLYGDSTMTSQINTLLTPDKDYNDYELTYQILPIYSNSPSTAQDITRNRFVPQFKSLNMWEGWWGGSDVYYTDNAGAIVLALLGLYPIQAPGAQWAITSPSVTTAVIHGIKDTIIQANNNSTRNTYISSIQVNGATYPSYFISGKRLVRENTTITLGMTSTPSRIGNMYVAGTDGEALAASTDNNTYLQFQNDPIALTSRAKIYATKQPTAVYVNGLPLTNWTYDSSTSTLNIKGIPAGNVLISFGGTVYTYQGHASVVIKLA
jgi:putative alpha-1,2-mannosidase